MVRDKNIHNRWGIRRMPIIFALIPLMLFGGFFLFSTLRNPHTAAIKPIIANQNPVRSDQSIDSDRDALKDWEEQIYGTDPHNADTDGDGTKDGDEIALGRNPLKPSTSKDQSNPNDALTQKIPLVQSSSSDEEGESNLTKKIAEVFTHDYLLKLIQNPDEQQDFDAIVERMTQAALKQMPPETHLLMENDIIISRDNGENNIKNYLQEFASIAIKDASPIQDKKDTVAVIFDLIQDPDNSAAQQGIAGRIDVSDRFLKDIKKIPVPNDFAALHLDYLNAGMRQGEGLKKIRDIKNDALLAVIGVREVIQSEIQFQTILKQYQQILKDKNITVTLP